MPSLPFTLRQLEIFSSLSQTGSFRRCAEELGISQASVSNQIKVLEEQMGTRLFDRKPGRHPILTAEGRAFEDDLREFYRAAQVLANHRKRSGDAQVAITFRLLVGQGMFDGYVRPKLDRFFAENPMIELDFESLPPTSEVRRMIEGGRYDFAIINLREDLPFEGLRPLATLEGGIYGHKSYANGRDLPLSAEEINLLPFVLPQAGSRQERELLAGLDRVGIRPRKVVGHSQYYDVMAAMLERGVAVASLSKAILPPAMRDEVICLMPLIGWRLLLYRKQPTSDPRYGLVERFLIDSLVGDPDFPAIEKFVSTG